MKEFFQTYPLLAWSVVSTLCAAVVIMLLWEKVKWWWFNTWVSFPVVGRIARLSRDPSADQSFPGWYTAERTLCQEYKDFAHIQDEHDFNEKKTYLKKAGDNGRSAMPGWIWALTVAMVFVEAMGFSYVLAGYTIPGASENLQQTGAYGIAFLISVVLVAFTHLAGHQLYRSNLIKNARKVWVANGCEPPLKDGTLGLDEPQSKDNHEPACNQLCSRVGAHPNYFLCWGTLVFVVVIAGFATYVRGQVLEKELAARVTLAGQQITQGASPAADGMDMSAGAVRLPGADEASDNIADKKAVADEASLDRHGGWATFIILAFIFVFLQILGVIFGFRWGFAGKESSQANRDIGGGRYSSYAAVRENYRRTADTAQARLAVLQQRIMKNTGDSGTVGTRLKKTFRDFMQESRELDEADRDDQRRHAEASAQKAAKAAALAAQVAASAAQAAPAAAPAPAPAPAPAAVAAAPADAAPELAEVLARLAALGEDKKAKLDLLDTLSSETRAAVIDALRAQKAEAERKARDAEVEGLL
ncbi:hypothetical protein GTP41_10050 [Pseudoduganella sp. DS3]|uniref:Uncharacterized protein n=1 Tax=Pseudoduganella guangdongensis TaxID=2692179 RepID=A0A6N9HFS0_9BURK|nr:hypothetical protein [Pseudoduganella guangdongensis]MYN02441.1 hypothetical protein [Pseudoduganella guangdongensis]